ncbi:hypothetical protein TNCT_139211 [Trichonephila clavata]|uniref:Uncharacterized protein n=1 Tax=Trichonephila clavata TaxID=2740835 RepID=A0A8X6GE70_TRICU|nr:hypothetical protein TNCT_139211 [Trichonephila clavata]
MYSSLLLDETRTRAVDPFTSARRDNHPGIRQTIWQYSPVRPFLSGVANHTKHLCSGVTYSKEGYYPISFGVRRVKEGPSRREQTKRNLRSRQYDPQVGASEKFTFYRLRFSIFNLQQSGGEALLMIWEKVFDVRMFVADYFWVIFLIMKQK